MTDHARFWDRHAAGYAAGPIADEAAYQHKLDKTREYFTPDSEVFEFGCGTGSTALKHAPYVRHILATDVSAEMLRIARERAEQAGIENVRFERAAFEDLDPGEFDVVMAHSILHLLDDRDEALNRARHWVRPGGVLVSSTACLGDNPVFAVFHLLGPLGRLFALLPRLRIFSRKQLRRSFERAGFEIVHDWRPKGAVAVFIIARRPD